METGQSLIEPDLAFLQHILSEIGPAPVPKRPATAAPHELNWNLSGFCGKVRIGTVFGDLPVEALRVGDDLRTNAGRVVKVRWIDKINLDEAFLERHPESYPIRIGPNAIGPDKPLRELLISPFQKISKEAHVVGHFIKASEIQGRVLAYTQPTSPVTYYRFHCGEPAIVRAEGVWVRVEPPPPSTRDDDEL